MFNSLHKAWIGFLLAATLLLLLWHRYGMDRTIRLDGRNGYRLVAFDDRPEGGASVSTLAADSGGLSLECYLSRKYQWPYCGFSVLLGDETGGPDLSRFESLVLDLEASGPVAPSARVHIRNHHAAYAKAGNQNSLKVNELQFFPAEEARPLEVPLANFQVASWWINEHRVPPKHASPDMRNVPLIQFLTGDNLEAGRYRFVLHSAVIRGKWLSSDELLSAIIALWVVSSVIYLALGYLGARRAMTTMGLRKQELEAVNAALEIERRELQELAERDELTGLHNRIGLRNRLVEAIGPGRAAPASLSLIFMDLDHFKSINDRHGHAAGDQVLKAFAEIVRANVRSDDFLCRWGGEEFILLCRDLPLEHARDLAEKLRLAVERGKWPHGVAVTCSFGVARLLSREDIGHFIRRADAALYRAKARGRNRVVADGEQEAPRSGAAVPR